MNLNLMCTPQSLVQKKEQMKSPQGHVYDITIVMIMIIVDVIKVGGDEIVTGD